MFMTQELITPAITHATVKFVCFDFDNVVVDGNFFMTALKLIGDEAPGLRAIASLLRTTRDPNYFDVFIHKVAELLVDFEFRKIRNVVGMLKPMNGILETFKELKKRNIKIIILSTNDERLIKEFLKRNGIIDYVDEVHGVVMEVKGGRLTGKFTGSLTPTQKLNALKLILKLDKIKSGELMYVGDGLTDMPIFENADKGIVFCPDPITKISILTNQKTVDRINRGLLLIVQDKDLRHVLELLESD